MTENVSGDTAVELDVLTQKSKSSPNQSPAPLPSRTKVKPKIPAEKNPVPVPKPAPRPNPNDSKNKDKLAALLGSDRAKPWYQRPILWIGVLAVILIGVGIWWWLERQAAAAVPVYNTEAVVIGDVTLSVVANGTLQPIRTYAISSELSGTVLRVNADVNDVVRRGQVLVELDSSKLRDQITRTQASLASARGSVAQSTASVQEARISLGRLENVWRLSGGQVPSRAELDTAQANLARAQAAVAIANASVADALAALSTDQINLSKAAIRAPADGVVLTRSVEPGNAVAAALQAVTLMTLASDLSRLRVWGYVDEADVGAVKNGQQATFTVSAFLNRQFPAVVMRVGLGSTITDNVVTYLTYLDVDNADLLLRPGMTATATIVADRHVGVLLVPNTALRFSPTQDDVAPKTKSLLSTLGPPQPRRSQTGSTAGARVIYVLRDGNPVAIPIQPGLSDGRVTEILLGELKVGMLVITDQRARTQGGSGP